MLNSNNSTASGRTESEEICPLYKLSLNGLKRDAREARTQQHEKPLDTQEHIYTQGSVLVLGTESSPYTVGTNVWLWVLLQQPNFEVEPLSSKQGSLLHFLFHLGGVKARDI